MIGARLKVLGENPEGNDQGLPAWEKRSSQGELWEIILLLSWIFTKRGENELGTMMKLCPGKSTREQSSNTTNETWVRCRKDLLHPLLRAGLDGGSACNLSACPLFASNSQYHVLQQLLDFSLFSSSVASRISLTPPLGGYPAKCWGVERKEYKSFTVPYSSL